MSGRMTSRFVGAGPAATAALEAFVAGTLPATATAVTQRAAGRRDAKINEQSHLAPCYRDVLKDATKQSPYRPALAGERVLGDCEQWPGVGDVDALVGGPGGPAWIELKCHSATEALCACAWDAVKLALALKLKRAASAYLLAATTVDNWGAAIRGAEFFGPHRVDATASVRGRFADWFEHWERRPDPLPLVLATRLATELVASVPFRIVGGADYELRLARVSVVDATDFLWPPFLLPEQRGKPKRAKGPS